VQTLARTKAKVRVSPKRLAHGLRFAECKINKLFTKSIIPYYFFTITPPLFLHYLTENGCVFDNIRKLLHKTEQSFESHKHQPYGQKETYLSIAIFLSPNHSTSKANPPL